MTHLYVTIVISLLLNVYLFWIMLRMKKNEHEEAIEHIKMMLVEHFFNPQPNDSRAMDDVHAQLSGKMWKPETLDNIASIVSRTGRVIRGPS